MPTPVDFMIRYHSLRVQSTIDDANQQCRLQVHEIKLRTYFMMDWEAGTEEKQDFDAVTSKMATGKTEHSRATAHSANQWLSQRKEQILSAAMGKDYELALEWAIRSGKISNPTTPEIQKYCDDHLGIDCSGFATNYLVANNRLPYSPGRLRNTNAQSYYKPAHAVNDPGDVRQGDLLVWMTGNQVKTGPGHVAVVQEYFPICRPTGNLHVVEATGSKLASPKLLKSWYHVEQIIPPARGANQVMILKVKRLGVSGDRVCVMRPA